jgi:hypothetical protein
MAHIFLDESGDLGFDPKKQNSRNFVVTILATTDKKPIEKCVTRVHKSLRKKVKKLSGGVLHSHKEKPSTRTKLLTLLNKQDISVMAICLNKTKVYTNLQNEKHVLYNYVTNILLDRILSKRLLPSLSQITLVAAKRETNKFLNDNFVTYLKDQAKQKHNIQIEIVIKNTAEEKGLQAVDFICWAIFKKYETEEDQYYKIIKEKIVEENKLYP